MAQNAPKSVEIEQIQFKLHTKANIFDSNGQLKSNVNLLATSSNYGLIFVGDPNKPQLKAVPLQGVINAKNLSDKLLCREVPLPNTPDNIAISCDGSLLAVIYTVQNTCFLTIYSVPSFWSPNIITKFANIPLVNENNVTVTQILWNPVISNTLAIILNNGALLMYNLKDGTYEFFTLDKAEQAKCASWSPKGKQIVVGFPAGKLVQFKPDLKPARQILCPNNIHDGPFDTIAIQWLSTYQFAAAFLQHGEDLTPCLYIINAPKVGNPMYINYYDICYGASGPRIGQIFLIHIQSWNLLIVASANSMEMGILGTTEISETPTWYEYTMSDSVRLALPMTVDKEETFPIGITLDTGITHQLIMNENQLPVMPMFHLLSTHGQLVSFDLLNLSANTPGICSPPQFIAGQAELSYFKPFESVIIQKQQQQEQIHTQPITPQSDVSFMDNFGAATSTPTPKAKPKQFFGDPSVTTPFGTLNKPPSSGNLFGGIPQQQTATPETSQFPGLEQLPASNFFGGSAQQQQQSLATKPTGQILFGGVQNTTTTANLFNLPSSTTVQPVTATISKTKMTENVITNKPDNSEKNKPLYTIPPTFKPTIDNKPTSSVNLPQYKEKTEKSINFNDAITLNVIQEMIAIEVNSFELELNELSKKSKSVDISVMIGNIDESKNCTKRLDDLKVINEQAEETFFETDVQVLRHSVNECFSMIAESKSKLEIFENPEMYKLAKISGCDQSNRRKLAKLNSYVATNHVELKMIQQQIDSNWSAYQDLVHQNSKVRMHIPSLEGIYQTLTKQKDILSKQRKKLSYIKTKLNIRELIGDSKSLSTTGNNLHLTVDSLADSILSMSLSEHVKKENSRLNKDKIQAIRDTLKGRKILVVKPHRPERMKSEVILECKLRTEIMYCDKCKKIIPTIEAFRCNGNCNKLYHPNTQCTKLTDNEIEMILKNKNIKYECDDCVECNRSLFRKFESLLESVNQNKENIIKEENAIREVIEEYKIIAIRRTNDERKRDGAVTKPEKMMSQSRIKNQSQQQQEQIILTKPAATKPIVTKPINKESFKQEQLKLDPVKPVLNFTAQGNTQFGIVGTAQQTTDKSKSWGIPHSNSESTNIFSSSTFATSSIPNATGGVGFFGATNQNSGNLFGSKQPPTSTLFSGSQLSDNTTEKSAFAIPATFSGFSSTTDSKNDNINPSSSIPSFNIGATNQSSVKITTAQETQQQQQQQKQSNNNEINNIFTPLTSSNSAPTFSGFNLGASHTPTTTKTSIFETFPTGAKITGNNPATTTTAATNTSTIKDPTDEILENLNICKPTAKVAENFKAENMFGLQSTTASNSPFADLGSVSSSNNANIKTTFSGFGSATTSTDSFKPAPVEITTTETNTSKPLFSGFGTTWNIKTGETPKIPFTGFGDTKKTAGFTGFGGAELSKPLFSGFGASVTTTTSEVTKTPFSGFGASTISSESSKTQFTTTTSEVPKTPFSSLGATVVTTSTVEPNKSSLSSATPTTTTTATEILNLNFAGLGTTITSSDNNTSSIFGAQLNADQNATTLTTTATTTSSANTISSSTFGGALNLKLSTAPLFGSSTTPLDTTTPITSISDAPTTQVTIPASQSSIFSVAAPTATTGFGMFSSSGSSSIFGGATMTPDSLTTTTSLGFGNFTVTTTSAPSIFAAAAANTSPFAPTPASSVTSIFGTTSASTPGTLFGGAAAANTGGSIFGSIPKPDQSVFSTAATPFGTQPSSGGSIFGNPNASNQPASPFGQQTSPFQSAGTSIFGGQKTETTSIFGKANQSNQQSSGGSIFGQQATSPFGVSQEISQPSIFAAAAAEQSGFGGGGGSIFGATNQNINSPFGGAAQTPGFGTGAFSAGGATGGAFSGFGAPPNPSVGAFAQGGPSIAQTGFGSPNSSFSKPAGVFGGAPAFGSPPTFGNSPAFGGPPTFGGFGSPQPTGGTSPTAFSPTTQKNNLFEALGSSGDNVSSFGNLAQSANQNTAKPAFPGGSSFSSWR